MGTWKNLRSTGSVMERTWVFGAEWNWIQIQFYHLLVSYLVWIIILPQSWLYDNIMHSKHLVQCPVDLFTKLALKEGRNSQWWSVAVRALDPHNLYLCLTCDLCISKIWSKVSTHNLHLWTLTAEDGGFIPFPLIICLLWEQQKPKRLQPAIKSSITED